MPYQANRRKKSKIVGKKENLAKRKIQNGQKKGAPIALMCEEQNTSRFENSLVMLLNKGLGCGQNRTRDLG